MYYDAKNTSSAVVFALYTFILFGAFPLIIHALLNNTSQFVSGV